MTEVKQKELEKILILRLCFYHLFATSSSNKTDQIHVMPKS